MTPQADINYSTPPLYYLNSAQNDFMKCRRYKLWISIVDIYTSFTMYLIYKCILLSVNLQWMSPTYDLPRLSFATIKQLDSGLKRRNDWLRMNCKAVPRNVLIRNDNNRLAMKPNCFRHILLIQISRISFCYVKMSFHK